MTEMQTANPQAVADPLGDGSIQLTMTEATFVVTLSFEEYDKAGKFFQAEAAASNWHLGDWLSFGEATYHERAYSAVDPALFDPTRTARARNTVDAFPPEDRREDMSFEHHAEVANRLRGEGKLAERLAWLERAKVNGWDPGKLGAEIRAAEAIEVAEVGEDESGETVVREPSEALLRVSVRIDLGDLEAAMDLKGLIEADVQSTLEQNGVSVRGVETAWSKS